MPALKTFGKFWAEFVDPESNSFVTDANVALRQQVFDISNAEIESVIEPNGVLNDRWREPMSFVDVLHADMLPEDRLTCQYPEQFLQRWSEANTIQQPKTLTA